MFCPTTVILPAQTTFVEPFGIVGVIGVVFVNMIDDKVTTSCLVFAPEANGATILTVEGLADSGQLHPLQQCFLEGAALQCGICTPGFLIAAKALLDKNPDPTETEIRYALAGNLCRCTGYDKIIRAVQEAAREMRGQ